MARQYNWCLYACCNQHQLYSPATHPLASFSTLSGSWVLRELGHPLGTHQGCGVVGEQGDKQRQVKTLCGRGGLSFTVIQVPVRLKEREGEVAWRTLAFICLPPTPTYHRQWLAGWWLLSGRMGTGGDITVSVRHICFAVAEHCSVILPSKKSIDRLIPYHEWAGRSSVPCSRILWHDMWLLIGFWPLYILGTLWCFYHQHWMHWKPLTVCFRNDKQRLGFGVVKPGIWQLQSSFSGLRGFIVSPYVSDKPLLFINDNKTNFVMFLSLHSSSSLCLSYVFKKINLFRKFSLWINVSSIINCFHTIGGFNIML